MFTSNYSEALCTRARHQKNRKRSFLFIYFYFFFFHVCFFSGRAQNQDLIVGPVFFVAPPKIAIADPLKGGGGQFKNLPLSYW
jgi:hypothetical protein